MLVLMFGFWPNHNGVTYLSNKNCSSFAVNVEPIPQSKPIVSSGAPVVAGLATSPIANHASVVPWNAVLPAGADDVPVLFWLFITSRFELRGVPDPAVGVVVRSVGRVSASPAQHLIWTLLEAFTPAKTRQKNDHFPTANPAPVVIHESFVVNRTPSILSSAVPDSDTFDVKYRPAVNVDGFNQKLRR